MDPPVSYAPPLFHAPEPWALNTPRMSLDQSIHMLRSLSMSGSWPGVNMALPIENWGQRRESGKVLDPDIDDVNGMDWYMGAGVPQAV